MVQISVFRTQVTKGSLIQYNIDIQKRRCWYSHYLSENNQLIYLKYISNTELIVDSYYLGLRFYHHQSWYIKRVSSQKTKTTFMHLFISPLIYGELKHFFLLTLHPINLVFLSRVAIEHIWGWWIVLVCSKIHMKDFLSKDS